MKKQKTFAVTELEDGAKTYFERNKIYGESYKQKGKIMEILFPDGLTLKTADEFNRYSMMGAVIGKMIRYSSQFKEGGHYDSAHDAMVYAALLNEVDNDAKG